MQRLKEALKELLKKDTISEEDIEFLKIEYSVYKGFSDYYNTMTPIDRKRVVQGILDALNGNLKLAALKHVAFIRTFVDNLIPYPQEQQLQVLSKVEETKKIIRDIGGKTSPSATQEELLLTMGPTLRKYAGLNYVALLRDLREMTRIVQPLSVKASSIIPGKNIDRLHTAYMAKVKRMALPVGDLDKTVGKNDTLIYHGRYHLIICDEYGVPSISTVIFPQPSEFVYPLATPKHIEEVLPVISAVYHNISRHYFKRKDILKLADEAIVNLTFDPDTIYMDDKGTTEEMFNALTSISNIERSCAITLAEVVGYLYASIHYRYTRLGK